jgi:putative transposase
MPSTCDFAAGKSGEYGGGFGSAFSANALPSPSSIDGLHNGPSRQEHKKKGGDQALGRSRGGLSTKIHAATIDENCSVALHLTAGHANDGGQFESLYEADRIREWLSYDGVEAVISPIPTRVRKLPYDHARYRERNRIERFFNKLKHFRRTATRYDKLAKPSSPLSASSQLSS